VAVQLGYKKVYRDPLGYPQWKAKGLPIAKSPVAANLSSQGPRPPGQLFGWAMVGTLLAVFLGGLALNLTPCVYPLIPITVSYFGGRSGQSQGGGVLAHGLFYLGGLVLVNSVLGVTAALTGGLMGSALQSPVVLVLVAAVLTAFALSMFGLWEIKLPSFLTNAAAKGHSGYFGSLFMGLTLGVVAAPCIGPFILGLLTWVASLGSPWLGFIIFFTLSLGLGLPLFVLALFSGKLDSLPRSGEWMLWVRKLMGWVLLGMAAYFLGPLLPHGGRYPLLALVALSGAVHLGWLERSKAAFKGFQWMRTFAALAGLILATYLAGVWLMMGPGVSWKPYSDGLLAMARQQGKPVIIDFYADWCAPCRELGDITLHDKRVVQLADQRFVMIKVDLTTKDQKLHPPLLAKYKVLGVPTVIFIDAKGQPRPELRLVDFLPADRFLARMKRLLEPSKTVEDQLKPKGER
jgi:thiol:disulfide interchange protein DsbD